MSIYENLEPEIQEQIEATIWLLQSRETMQAKRDLLSRLVISTVPAYIRMQRRPYQQAWRDTHREHINQYNRDYRHRIG